MFPIENMPELIQYGTYLNSLRHFLVILRGIFLKGNGIAILWPQMLAPGTIEITVNSLRFNKRLG
jgi:ABC-2 type transport system permease protein